MANAKKCDRCGAFYGVNEDREDRIHTIVGLSVNLHSYPRYFDLCPECEKSLDNWLKDLGRCDLMSLAADGR